MTVMQFRCVFCLKEHPGIAVFDISHGRSGCIWCGMVPPVYEAVNDYLDALAESAQRWDRRGNDGATD